MPIQFWLMLLASCALGAMLVNCDDLNAVIVAVGITVTVVGLVFCCILLIVPAINQAHNNRVEECLQAFEYTRAQCEYFATHGGPYK